MKVSLVKTCEEQEVLWQLLYLFVYRYPKAKQICENYAQEQIQKKMYEKGGGNTTWSEDERKNFYNETYDRCFKSVGLQPRRSAY